VNAERRETGGKGRKRGRKKKEKEKKRHACFTSQKEKKTV